MSGNPYCTVAFLTYEAMTMNGFFSPSLSVVLRAFPHAFIGLNEARLPRLLRGLPRAFEKHATGCGWMLRTNCCVRNLVHQGLLLRCDVGGLPSWHKLANNNATQFQNVSNQEFELGHAWSSSALKTFSLILYSIYFHMGAPARLFVE